LRSSGSDDEVTKIYQLQRSFGQGQNGKAAPITRSWGQPLTADQSFDHAREAFDNGHILDNTLTVSGGNDRTTFYLSGNYNNNQGVFVGPNNFFDRSTARLN